MKTIALPNTDLKVTRIAYGCMQIGGTWDSKPLTAETRAQAARVVARALECGINFFDHADIYCRGKSETVFGEIMHEAGMRREDVILQSKSGIIFPDDPNPGDPARFDFSYDHLVRGVEGSLRRLQTDYLDILLLHRPDALVEPAEVARAFDDLQSAGKVRYFGVSNQTPTSIELLKRYVKQPLVVNQVELNLLHADLIDDLIFANNAPRLHTAAAGTLDYCRLHDIVIQAWAPVAGGALLNPKADAPQNVQATAALIAQMAVAKNTSREGILLGWLLRHPAPIQPILGTTKPERVAASVLADEVELTREEWYKLLETARGTGVP